MITSRTVTRRIVTRLASLLACALTVLPVVGMGAAQAQSFPSKPITLLVGFPAGGTTDIAVRAMADAASKDLGQPVVVDNKAGGGGTVAIATMAATARPDGHTIAIVPANAFRLLHMQATTYDPLKDFSYIANLSGYTFGVTVKADAPYKTFQDLIEFARANPGKVTYGTPGAGSSLHIGMEQIAQQSKVKFTHVPFRGTAETNAAVLGGHIVAQADASGWRPLVQSGDLRLLVVWTAERLKTFPDVPTLKDSGFPLVVNSPFGIAGPRNMDPAIVKRLEDAFRKALDDQGVRDTLAKYDMVPDFKDAKTYRAFAEASVETERTFIQQLGLGKK
jgi:tripartite-type tricarboxylate transporter receptor subunit TctC